MVEIRPVIMEQEKYFPLLQEIEPSGEMVERNLREGEFYLLEAEREAVYPDFYSHEGGSFRQQTILFSEIRLYRLHR